MPVIIPDDLIKKAKEAAAQKKFQLKNKRKKIVPIIWEMVSSFNESDASDSGNDEEGKIMKGVCRHVHRLIRATRKSSQGFASLHALTEVILDFEAIKSGNYILMAEE